MQSHSNGSALFPDLISPIKPSNFIHLPIHSNTQTIRNRLKMSKSRDNCQFPFQFNSCELLLPPPAKKSLGCSQVWNKTRNYSMKVCLNVTLSLTWAGKHHNWPVHRINPPQERSQGAPIPHEKASSAVEEWGKKIWKKSSILNGESFNEWKHGSHTHRQASHQLRRRFFFTWLESRMNEKKKCVDGELESRRRGGTFQGNWIEIRWKLISVIM